MGKEQRDGQTKHSNKNAYPSTETTGLQRAQEAFFIVLESPHSF